MLLRNCPMFIVPHPFFYFFHLQQVHLCWFYVDKNKSDGQGMIGQGAFKLIQLLFEIKFIKINDLNMERESD